jgi:Sulfotransferase domain
MTMPPPLATFVVIGPGKAGTTWMYSLLKAHPEVCVAAAKETMFFDTYYHKGIDWYHQFYPSCSGWKAVGEVCNSYILSEEAPARMRAYNPALKLIASLRNPIDRAFSNYLFFLRNAQVAGSFEDALAVRPDLLTQGLYARHLERYLAQFPSDQLLMLAFDDLQRDSLAFARQLLAFIEVDGEFVPDVTAKKVLGASRPRSRIAARLVKQAAVAVRRAGMPDVVTRVKSSGLPGLLYRQYTDDGYPMMRTETRAELVRYFSPDVARLSELTGRDFKVLWLAEPGVPSPAGT